MVETRRRSSRRLSKPPTHGPAFNSSRSTLKVNDAEHALSVDPSMIWQSPWTGDLLPKSSTIKTDSEKPRICSSSSFTVLPTAQSLPSRYKGHRWSSYDGSEPSHQQQLSSRSSISTFDSSGAWPSLDPQPRARRSFQREPPSHFSFSDLPSQLILEEDETDPADKTLERLKAPPYTSLIRRRSLVTPGIATRNPDRSWRQPSTVEEEGSSPSGGTSLPSRHSQWPLINPSQPVLEDTLKLSDLPRTASPVALDYSHLGGLKKGSLHIVNGTISPAPSDRSQSYFSAKSQSESRIDERGSSGPHHHEARFVKNMRGIEHVFEEHKNIHRSSEDEEEQVDSRVVTSTSPPETSTLRSFGNLKDQKSTVRVVTAPKSLPQPAPTAQSRPRQTSNQDAPATPFSFEPSPTTATYNAIDSSFSQRLDDEGINMSYDQGFEDSKSVRSPVSSDEDKHSTSSSSLLDKRPSQTLRKADSGYSSVTSLSSMHNEQTGYNDPGNSPPLPSTSPPQTNQPEPHLNPTSTGDRLPRRRLRRASRDCSGSSSKEHIPQKSISPPQLSISTMCHEHGDVGRPEEKHASSNRRYPAETKINVPRYYARARSHSSSTVQPPAQDGEERHRQARTVDIERRRFMTTSQGDLRGRRNAAAESEGFQGSPPARVRKDRSASLHRRQEEANSNHEYHGHQRPRGKSNPVPYLHGRSRSEPRLAQAANYPYGMNEEQRSVYGYPSQRIDYVPPVPTLPSVYDTLQKVQGRVESVKTANSVHNRSWTRNSEFSRLDPMMGREPSTQLLFQHDDIPVF